MNNYVLVRVFGIVVIIIIIVAAVVQLANIGSGDEADVETPFSEVTLQNMDLEKSLVRYTIDGPIVSREEHRTIRMSITPSNRTIEILSGYEGNIIERKTYPNDAQAYEEFIRALDYEGYDNVRENTYGKDFSGVCPAGSRYINELFSDGELRRLLWRTTCSSKDGTLDGDSQAIRQLFVAQFPDYKDITRGLSIR